MKELINFRHTVNCVSTFWLGETLV